MQPLSHFDPTGASRMVDTSAKAETDRVARARAQITMKPETLALIRDHRMAKGDVFEVARLAGIMASKRTSELIPLCHPLPIAGVTLDFEIVDEQTIAVEAEVRVHARTGVEMEALTAAAVAALTVYDMCKSVDRAIVLGPIMLLEKSGGKSGHFQRSELPPG